MISSMTYLIFRAIEVVSVELDRVEYNAIEMPYDSLP